MCSIPSPIWYTEMFTMLVIMALASTFMATPLIRWLMAGERRAVLAA